MSTQTTQTSRTAVDVVKERVSALIPTLREHAAEIDRISMLPADALAAMDDTGVFKIGLPERFGGLPDVSVRDQFDILVGLAKGNGSAAWNAFVTWPIAGMAAAVGDAVAEEIFSTAHVGPLLSASALNPAHSRGCGRPVNGGMMLTGSWMFASGVRHCAWFLGGVTWEDANGAERRGFVLPPRDSFDVADNWNVEGMRGSNSNTVVVEDEIFVPEHRLTAFEDFASRYGGHLATSYPIDIFPTAIALGCAYTAVERFTEQAGQRGAWSTPYSKLADLASTQIVLAKASGDIAMVEAALHRVATTADEVATGALAIEPNEQAVLTFLKVHGAHQLLEAVERLQRSLGASAAAFNDPLSRQCRDIRVLCMHVVVRHDWAAEALGRALLDIQPATPHLLMDSGPA